MAIKFEDIKSQADLEKALKTEFETQEKNKAAKIKAAELKEQELSVMEENQKLKNELSIEKGVNDR